MSFQIVHGDCIEKMREMGESSVDAVVTDPPYHLTAGKKGDSGVKSLNEDSPAGRSRISTGFMGKAWDGGDVAFRPETWAEVLRVAKPGAHLLAFGGTRTFHRLTCAIEDGGWEIRDCLSYLYGSGFPKSLDVSKAMDKSAGAKRDVIGLHPAPATPRKGTFNASFGEATITAPSTESPIRWSGWGTALKPAWEPVILARKPFRQTVAANVLEHGTGAINIDACRIEGAPDPASWTAKRTAIDTSDGRLGQKAANIEAMNAGLIPPPSGRWPANVLLDEESARLLDEQSGTLNSGDAHVLRRGATTGKGMGYASSAAGNFLDATYGDSGGASRFFYTAKASRSEREEGLGSAFSAKKFGNWSSGEQNPGTFQSENTNRSARNHHPTVKPVDLMCWLVRLITPPDGLILDPFTGSGSTGCAAVYEGFRFIGIEKENEYVDIATARIRHWESLHQPSLFGGAA